MTREEEEKYLETWGDSCLICNEIVAPADKHMVSAVVPLDNLPEHAVSPVTKYYMCCRRCKEAGDLV